MKTIAFRVPDDWLDKVDAWIDGQPIPVSRSDLIRTVVDEYISQRPVPEENRKPKRPRPKDHTQKRKAPPEAEAAVSA